MDPPESSQSSRLNSSGSRASKKPMSDDSLEGKMDNIKSKSTPAKPSKVPISSTTTPRQPHESYRSTPAATSSILKNSTSKKSTDKPREDPAPPLNIPGIEHTFTAFPNGWTYSSLDGYRPPVGQEHLYPSPPHQGHPPCHFPGRNTMSAGDYTQNAFMPNTGQHFQPQVPDTTYGEILHTFTPRTDGTQPGTPVPLPFPYSGGFPQQQPPMMMGQPAAAAPLPVYYCPNTGQYFQAQPGNPAVNMPMVYQQYPGQQQPQPVLLQPGQPLPAGQYVVQPQMQTQPFFQQYQQPQRTQVYTPAQFLSQAPNIMAQQQQQTGGGAPFVIGNQAPDYNPFPFPPPQQGGPPGAAPDIMGIGKTRGEMLAEQIQAAQSNQADEPQDFKPADDDPSRMYWCRETDGDWTQRNRFAIDRLENCRWFIDNRGRFYVVRYAE